MVNTVCCEFGLKANAFLEAKDGLGEEIKNSEVVGKNSCKSRTLMTPRARARERKQKRRPRSASKQEEDERGEGEAVADQGTGRRWWRWWSATSLYQARSIQSA